MDNKKYKLILLQTFKAFVNICQQNEIKYYAAYGTAIGAVREHSIIEWDDDIDVWMLADDYKKFLNLRSLGKLKSLNGKYDIISASDNNCYIPYAKFYDTETTIWEQEYLPFLNGVFIDIFPLYEVENPYEKSDKLVSDYRKYANSVIGGMSQYKFRNLFELFRHGYIRTLYRRIVTILTTKASMVDLYRKELLKIEKDLQNRKGNYLLNPCYFYDLKREIFPKAWFDSAIDVSFEDTTIKVPKEYDKVLSQLYGDYLVPPPIAKRKSTHGHFFMNLERRIEIDEIKQIIGEK